MPLDGVDADHELRSDLAVRPSGCQELEYLRLPAGQAILPTAIRSAAGPGTRNMLGSQVRCRRYGVSKDARSRGRVYDLARCSEADY